MHLNEQLELEDIPESLKLAPYEATLLRMLFGKEDYTEESAVKLFEGLDLDTAGTPYLLLLAQFGRQMNWRYFPQLVKARVSGIQRWYHVKNAGLKPGLRDVIKKLQAENIDVMFLKGMTMQAFYDLDKVRLMHDADFTVRAKDLEKANSIVKAHYEDLVWEDDHHVTVKGKGTSLDSFELQQSYINYSTCDESIVWERALTTVWDNLQVYIPSPEDELVLLCDNDSRDFGNSNYIHMALKCIYDIGVLASSYDLDWDYIISSSHRFKNEYAMFLILSVASQYLPWLIPDDIFKKFEISEKVIVRNTKDILKYGKLNKERQKYKKNKFVYYFVKGIRIYPCMYRVMKIKGVPAAKKGFIHWVISRAKSTRKYYKHFGH